MVRATYPFGMFWTRERIVASLRWWADQQDRAPTYNAWRRADRHGRRPTSARVQQVLGSWSAALEAAGFEPRPQHGQADGKRCRNGHDLTVEAYVSPGGKRYCRACIRERERRQRARRAADRERKARHARKRRELGLCVRCGEQPAAPERTCCADCLTSLRDADRRRRQAKQAA
jgi:Homing endonuclease associated repeat